VAENDPTAWRLRLDLAVAHALLIVVSARRNTKLRPEVHLYFADRYGRLGAHYRQRRNEKKATALIAQACRHLHLAGGDGPPPSVALAMPRPRRPSFIEAIGLWYEKPSQDDAA
jgi:hypothetical protein